jgi:hypothetical protein
VIRGARFNTLILARYTHSRCRLSWNGQDFVSILNEDENPKPDLLQSRYHMQFKVRSLRKFSVCWTRMKDIGINFGHLKHLAESVRFTAMNRSVRFLFGVDLLLRQDKA